MHFCYNLENLEERYTRKKIEVDEGKGVSKEFTALVSTIGNYIGT